MVGSTDAAAFSHPQLESSDNRRQNHLNFGGSFPKQASEPEELCPSLFACSLLKRSAGACLLESSSQRNVNPFVRRLIPQASTVRVNSSDLFFKKEVHMNVSACARLHRCRTPCGNILNGGYRGVTSLRHCQLSSSRASELWLLVPSRISRESPVVFFQLLYPYPYPLPLMHF